jgi:hypothetical protein
VGKKQAGGAGGGQPEPKHPQQERSATAAVEELGEFMITADVTRVVR